MRKGVFSGRFEFQPKNEAMLSYEGLLARLMSSVEAAWKLFFEAVVMGVYKDGARGNAEGFAVSSWMQSPHQRPPL